MDQNDDDDSITDQDYGFILTSEGELKSLFLPVDMPEQLPKSVMKVFKALGVKDVQAIIEEYGSTLH